MALPGVDPYINQSKKDLLDAIARAGSQGEAAYKDAGSQITSYRQSAIDNAAKGFSGSAELAAQLQAQSGTPFDRRLADNASAAADHSAALSRMQSMNENYLTNVSAAQGTLQAHNANKLSERETQLKAIQAELEARAKQEAEDRAFKMQMELIKNQRDAEKHAADLAKMRYDAAKEKAPKPPSNKALLGAAAQQQKQSVNPAINPTVAGPVMPGQQFSRDLPDTGLTGMAVNIGRELGVPEDQMAEMYSPGEQHSLAGNLGTGGAKAPAALPAPLSRDWIAKNTSYSTTRAGEILAAPEIRLADTMIGTLAGTRYTNGRIDDTSVPAEYRGMTARQAFETWLDTLPGIRSMKDSLKLYYGPWLDTNLGR